MARRILDVFLSSTARDLEPHRAAIHAELMSTGLFHCVRQEDFGPQNADAVEFCRQRVKASEIFVGLTGQRRGWEPDGDNARRSITEMEHDWAKEAGCRRFLYVAPDNFAVPGNLRDSDEQYARQQAFRSRVMESGERIVSQKGFESPEGFAADIVKHLLTQLVTSDLITLLRPELLAQSPVSPDEQRPAVAAALERLADDKDVNLLALARDPKNVDLGDLEFRLKERAERHEAQSLSELKASAEYWRHIGALAFLHNTQKALVAYERAVALDPLEPDGWRYLGELQYRLGDLAHAEQSFARVLALGKSAGNAKAQATGHLRLGWIAKDRGDVAGAKTQIADAIRFAELADWREGLGRAYSNLGVLHQSRGELEQAEEMQHKALAIEEALASKEGMARAYGNLGIIHRGRSDFDKAEAMQRKALALNEELGRKEGVAAAYTNLGVIHEIRGELDKAETMQRRALMLHEELGSKEGMAATYSNLGIIHETRGEFDRAEAMFRKGLALREQLGQQRGIALAYGNLGDVYREKADKKAMCECWRKARDLYREMGLPDKADEVQKRLTQNGCGEN